MSEQVNIYNEMNSQAEKSAELSAVSTNSKVGVLRTILYVVSFAIALLRELFELHKQEVEDSIDNKQRHDLYWYKNLALSYQYGYNLVSETDYYDNSNLTDEEIESSKIVKYAVAVEEVDKSTVYIKVANSDRAPLSSDELTAFKAYLNEVVDLGVHVTVVNEVADQLKLELDVYYDPKVLRSDGALLSSTSTFPVKEAIINFVNQLDFNATYTSLALIDALQIVDGVEIPEVKAAYYKYGVMSFQPIQGRYISKSGNIDVSEEDLIINYIAL